MAQQAEQFFQAPLQEIYGFTEAGSVAARRTAIEPEWQLFEGVRLLETGTGALSLHAEHLAQPLPLQDILEPLPGNRFVLHGRNADLVNIAGKRTSLSALNHILCEIEGVRDGIFLVPEEAGENAQRLLAFVVADHLTQRAILDELSHRIDPVFLPRPLFKVEALPRAATGKLSRQALLELARQLRESAV
jgi:acyl-coenzyme A synthetase/AMP-(fatty) acid ligase